MHGRNLDNIGCTCYLLVLRLLIPRLVCTSRSKRKDQSSIKLLPSVLFNPMGYQVPGMRYWYDIRSCDHGLWMFDKTTTKVQPTAVPKTLSSIHVEAVIRREQSSDIVIVFPPFPAKLRLIRYNSKLRFKNDPRPSTLLSLWGAAWSTLINRGIQAME